MMSGSDSFIVCPVCQTRHVPMSGDLMNGVYTSQCQVCSQSFSYRAVSDIKSSITLTVNKTLYVVGAEFGAATMLVDYLRKTGISLGTKYMCREGGCGCCVVTATVHNNRTFAINSCLCPLYACDGWEITTIEGLGVLQTGLNPIQRELVEKNASQCGYCSPGFVMSMHGLLSNSAKPSLQQIEDSFDGNICRCTGYRSIYDAMRESSVRDIEDIMHLVCPSTGEPCPDQHAVPLQVTNAGVTWFRPTSVADLYSIMSAHKSDPLRLIYGNTGTGVIASLNPVHFRVLIDLHSVSEFNICDNTTSGLIIGSNYTLSRLIEVFKQFSSTLGYQYLATLAEHLNKVAHGPVRNAGTWAGNLMMKNSLPSFPSDIFVLLEGVGAKFAVGPNVQEVPIIDALHTDFTGRAIHHMRLPQIPNNSLVKTYKIMMRSQNCQAYVNALFRFEILAGVLLSKPSIVYGGISKSFVHATNTEDYLGGKTITDPSVLKDALKILEAEVIPSIQEFYMGSAAYRKSLALSLFYKYFLSINSHHVDLRYKSGGDNLVRPVSSSQVSYDTDETKWPLTQPVTKVDSYSQVTGQALFINDIQPSLGELHAAFVVSNIACADIGSIDPSPALALTGVLRFIQANDLPSTCVNDYSQPGNPPMEIFATKSVKYAGQSLGLIIAVDEQLAQRGANLVQVSYKNVTTPILDIPQAKAAKSFFPKPGRDIIIGNAEEVIASSPHKIHNVVRSNDQYHFTMENQIAICEPLEDGYIVHCSTQNIDVSQIITARAIGVKVNKISMTVKRLGGAYGSKISQNFIVSAASAIASVIMKARMRVNLDITTNMKMMGKRFAYEAIYDVGFNDAGKLTGIKADIVVDAGMDDTEASLGTLLSYMDNAYYCPNWHLIPAAVKTNKPPNTYCRAPGTTEAIFIIETILENVSQYLKVDPTVIKQRNLYSTGQLNIVNMPLKYCHIDELMSQLLRSCDYDERRQDVEAFNKANRWKKRGLAVVPLKYGVPWARSPFNVCVSVYHGDATVSVCHAGIEMGQGVNTKVQQVCAYELGLALDMVHIEPTNSFTGANSVVTGGSITSELNCQAVIECCNILKARMAPVKAKVKDPTWVKVVDACYNIGIDLCSRNWLYLETKYRFQYNTYGVTCAEAILDVLTGETQVTRVDILYDCGTSISPEVDVGQVEGAFVMGMGHYLTERIEYDQKTGLNLTHSTWTYKPPSSKDIPVDFRVTLLKDSPNPLGVLSSKVVGEPPLNMSCSVLFAAKHAVDAARAEQGKHDFFSLDCPAPVDTLQTACLNNPDLYVMPSA